MKKLNYLLTLAVLGVLFMSVGCDGDDGDDKPAVDVVGEDFQSTWTATSVQYGSPAEERTSDYSDFTLTIVYSGEGAGTYSTSGGPKGSGIVPFANSGTWSFTNPDDVTTGGSFNITRGDGLVMTVNTLNETTLSLTFEGYDDDVHESSRVDAVDGTWSFTFVRN